MRYNPCGYAVDWGRRPYNTKARFFKDSEEEVTIRWYPAGRAPFLPYPTSIISTDWVTQPFATGTQIGEVWGAARNYNRAKKLPGPVTGHICGTQSDFQDGGVYDPISPPVEYSADGLPLCCERPPYGYGGLALGGKAGVHKVISRYYSYGGVALGGAAEVVRSWERYGSGGIALGGAAGVSVTIDRHSYGGVALGGYAGLEWTQRRTGSGGLALGGAAEVDVILLRIGSGGIALGGAADVLIDLERTGSGGLALGGAAEVDVILDRTGSGGLALGGMADVTL